jgi:hypothetical protein
MPTAAVLIMSIVSVFMPMVLIPALLKVRPVRRPVASMSRRT